MKWEFIPGIKNPADSLSRLCIMSSKRIFCYASYEEGTPYCCYRRKPEALGAGQIHYVFSFFLCCASIFPASSPSASASASVVLLLLLMLLLRLPLRSSVLLLHQSLLYFCFCSFGLCCASDSSSK
jgi:hypothetical protein